MARTLYQDATSPACRAVRWCLEWKRLDHVAVDLDEGVRVELHRRFETDEVPLLVDGDAALAGLRPIAFYLERHHPEPSFFPTDPQKRNQAATFVEFAEEALGRLAADLRFRGEGNHESPERRALLAEMQSRLGQVREAIARRALDGPAPHLGDLAVAAHLVTCQEVPELDFARGHADLATYVVRFRSRMLRARGG